MRNFRCEASNYGKGGKNEKRRYNRAIKQGYTDRQAKGLATGHYKRK
jgi:hypothetical protein